jgi:hypothetical protein
MEFDSEVFDCLICHESLYLSISRSDGKDYCSSCFSSWMENNYISNESPITRERIDMLGVANRCQAGMLNVKCAENTKSTINPFLGARIRDRINLPTLESLYPSFLDDIIWTLAIIIEPYINPEQRNESADTLTDSDENRSENAIERVTYHSLANMEAWTQINVSPFSASYSFYPIIDQRVHRAIRNSNDSGLFRTPYSPIMEMFLMPRSNTEMVLTRPRGEVISNLRILRPSTDHSLLITFQDEEFLSFLRMSYPQFLTLPPE